MENHEVPAYMFVRHYVESDRRLIVSAVQTPDTVLESGAFVQIPEIIDEFSSFLLDVGVEQPSLVSILLVWEVPEYLQGLQQHLESIATPEDPLAYHLEQVPEPMRPPIIEEMQSRGMHVTVYERE